MHPLDQKAVLASMSILVDTREQDTARARRRYRNFKIPYRRKALPYGDYTWSAVLPDGTDLEPEHPPAVIERKMSLDELAGCFTRGRSRFQREFQRAADNNARIYLLVEDGSWGELFGHQYRSRLHENAFLASITAFMVRYNANFIFCREGESGRLIKEILYRDLKERLERGDYG